MPRLLQLGDEIRALSRLALNGTKLITQEDIESSPGWAMVAEEYRAEQKSRWVVRAQVSLINSILYHQKMVFILTRDGFAEICRGDGNWNKSLGFSPKNWSQFLLQASGIIKLEKMVWNPKRGRNIAVYRVIHPELLALIGGNADEQLKVTEIFIANEGLSQGNEKGNGTRNLEKEEEEGVTK